MNNLFNRTFSFLYVCGLMGDTEFKFIKQGWRNNVQFGLIFKLAV